MEEISIGLSGAETIKAADMEDTMKRNVYPGEFYRHFENKLYQVMALAEHSETGERMVVYQALYGDFRIFVQPYEMFVSEVDSEKYPQAAQTYQFERVRPGNGEESLIGSSIADSDTAGKTDSAKGPNQALLRFLDASDYDERIKSLEYLAETGTQSDMDSIYVVLDMKPQEGTIQEQIEAISKYLFVQNYYDGDHLR